MDAPYEIVRHVEAKCSQIICQESNKTSDKKETLVGVAAEKLEEEA